MFDELLNNTDDITPFLNKIIKYSIDMKSSDIHFEALSDKAIIRIRVDGKLINIYEYSIEHHIQLVTKIKIISNLNIAEKRLPQDGRITVDENTDIRISIINTVNGEKVEMRILSSKNLFLNNDFIGFSKYTKNKLNNIIKNSSGMLIFSGPTGSGKSTSLYSVLNKLNSQTKNIVTVEDPVEYKIDYINQIEVNEKIGLTFDKILRSILRQDPDVIMIGEIRDEITAKIAIRSAITGHFILSTVHTTNSFDAIIRLSDLGIENFLLSSTISAIISQRLVRKLCDKCKIKRSITDYEYNIMKNYIQIDKDIMISDSCGCEYCNYGYLGREAVEEIFILDNDIKETIRSGNYNSIVLKEMAQSNGFISILENGYRKVIENITSFSEVNRILSNFHI